MKETDLYLPCKELLESQGYEVKAEILQTDITAIKGNYIVIVELKLNISLKLIYQAIDRQKVADKVYVALPMKVFSSQGNSTKHFMNLLKRLEIGLIVVGSKAEIVIETFGFDLKRSISSHKKNKEKLIKEFSLRQSTINLGGTKGRKMTHYKEQVIRIATFLYNFGESSPKDIKAHTGIKDTANMLRKNYYAWFYNVRRGIYGLTETGKKEIQPWLTEGTNDYYDDSTYLY